MLSVGEMMRHDIARVPPHAPVRRVIEVMVARGVEGVLVGDGSGCVAGSIGDEQLVSRGEFWTDESSAISLFDEYAVNVVAVVDHGLLIGEVFRSDIIRRLLLPDPFGHPAET